MRQGLHLYLRLMGAHVRAQMQYKLSFVADVLSTLLGMLLEFASVWVLFTHIAALGGWSFPEVAFLYGTAELSLSLAQMLTSGFDYLPEAVRWGQFDSVLIRPRGLFFQVLASRLSMRRFGRALQGVFVLALALSWLDPSWDFGRWLFLGWTVLGGTLLFAGLFVVGATSSFWTVESLEVFNILTYGGSTLISYPLSIYSEWLRNVFLFVVPLGFANFYPALFLLGKDDPFGLPDFMPFLSVPLCALVFLLSLWFWRFGVRHYQSTGN